MQRIHRTRHADRYRSAASITVEVDDPERVAQQCWDAGLTIRVRQTRAGQTLLSVVDSLGCRIDLVPATDLSAAHSDVSEEFQ